MKVTIDDVKRELSRRHLSDFTSYVNKDMVWKEFHKVYYEILNMFAFGIIKNLITSMPSQHGKSEGSTRKLPAFIHGINPDCKIAIGSYASGFAQGFNLDVQRLIDSSEYYSIFPNSTLNGSTNTDKKLGFVRSAKKYEIVDHNGCLVAVGRGSGITGVTVDVMIMDDLYKDASEGNSPVIRRQVKSWYTSAVQKRLHNNSQQLVVFTRWHENDLIAYIEENYPVVECTSFRDIEEALEKDPDTFIKINFECIKDSPATEFDPRERGEALWEEKHSAKRMLKEKDADPNEFECMRQGKPESGVGLLYKEFGTYVDIPPSIKKGNYTDVADEGDDYLCSICYDLAYDDNGDKKCFVTDVEFTKDGTDVTEKTVAMMLTRNITREANIESNNGGKSFARHVGNNIDLNMCEINTPYQSGNKESRILTNKAQVNSNIFFPFGWEKRWPEFHKHVTKFKKQFSSNSNDDGPDCLTGIYETEFLNDFDPFV